MKRKGSEERGGGESERDRDGEGGLDKSLGKRQSTRSIQGTGSRVRVEREAVVGREDSQGVR